MAVIVDGAPIPMPVETPDSGPLQPVHPLTQIRLLQFHPKVKVISSRFASLISLWRDLKHDHIGMHAPSKTLSRLAQSPLKGFCSTLPGKDPLSVIPAIDHMIAPSRVLYS